MPTYTYRCINCEHQYDVFQSMKEDSHTICPSCKGEVRRVIGLGGGIVFKGKGFYVTDYKNNQTSKNESSETNNQTNTQKEGNNMKSKENVKIDKSNSPPSESTQTSNTKPDIKEKKETNTATTVTSK